MSTRLIQDLHAGISRRDWSSVETAANRLRDEIEKTVALLAGSGIGSLPNDYPISKLAADLLSEAEKREREVRPGWAFAEGDLVRKKSGSWWEGRIVGTYSTEQTPRGYAVQLDKPFGPVQIYPESALEPAFTPMSEAELVDALDALQSEER